MSGKCRPSLRKKTIMVVKQSDFSKAVKECIFEVFARYERMIEKPMTEEEQFEDDYPCNHCDQKCDGWDARFCCTLCHYNGVEDCENCDPRDI